METYQQEIINLHSLAHQYGTKYCGVSCRKSRRRLLQAEEGAEVCEAVVAATEKEEEKRITKRRVSVRDGNRLQQVKERGRRREGEAEKGRK